ncbi:hypothetical protein OAO87_01665 [bacterium]|nr:hypothetical protein [bacterium]
MEEPEEEEASRAPAWQPIGHDLARQTTSPQAVLDAMLTLARARDEDVNHALGGLMVHISGKPHGEWGAKHLHDLATRSCAFLRQVAVASDAMDSAAKVRRETAIEMAALRTRSENKLDIAEIHPSSFDTFGSDFVPLIVQACVPSLHCSGGWYKMRVADNMCQCAHYRASALLAQINSHWAAAVLSWRLAACTVWLEAPDDEMVQRVVRLSPNVVELQIHHRWGSSNGEEDERVLQTVSDDAVAALCQQLGAQPATRIH